MVVHGLDGALPLVLVVGEHGTGKTALLQAVAERLGSRARVVLTSGRGATFETIVARCLAGLGVPVIDEPPIMQIRRLADRLVAARREGRGLVLMVDDAELLDVHTLLELRLLLAPTAAGKALLPLALAGPPALRQRLLEPPLETLGASVLLEVGLECPPPSQHMLEPAPLLAPACGAQVPPPAGASPREDDARAAALLPALVPAVLEPPDPSHPRRPWALATATTMLCATIAFVGLERMPRWDAPVAPARAILAPPLPAPRLPEPPPTAAAPARRDGPLSADEARLAVNAFREAVALGDVQRLRRLLTPDAEQHELRGRDEIADAYAYRFERMAHQTDILAPERIVLREDDAIVTAPFVDWYRDAAGRPGTLGGTARWRVVRRDGRVVVARIDYEYALQDVE